MTSGLNANAMKMAIAPIRRRWAGLNGIEARTRRKSLADGLEDGEDPSSRAESPTTARILDERDCFVHEPARGLHEWSRHHYDDRGEQRDAPGGGPGLGRP